MFSTNAYFFFFTVILVRISKEKKFKEPLAKKIFNILKGSHVQIEKWRVELLSYKRHLPDLFHFYLFMN